jgi:hypothetical protein
LHQKPATILTAPHWSDPETVTLEQIDENSHQLLQEWPKEDGIPFSREILETLRDLKLKVLAQDAEKRCSMMVSVDINTDTAGTMCTPASPHFAIGSLKPNMPVPNLQDLVFATTNNPVQPTATTADLWQKVARKTVRIAYQHEYYGTVL